MLMISATTTEPITELQFYATRGHNLAYLAHHPERTARPLVFIHGLTASVNFWEAAMYDYVRTHHPWYSVSLPLHSPSTFPPELPERGISEQALAELLMDVIDHIEPRRSVIVIGYSLGGFAGLNLAAKFPERIHAVVSIGGFTSGRARGLEGVLQQLSKGHVLRRLIFYSVWRAMQLHRAFLKLAVMFYACDTRALLRYPLLDPTLDGIFPDVRRHDIEAMRLLFRYVLDMNVEDELHRIRQPVLVFAGECDPIVPYDHQRHYARALPACTFCSLPGAGHVVFAERAEAFERQFIDWLKVVG